MHSPRKQRRLTAMAYTVWLTRGMPKLPRYDWILQILVLVIMHSHRQGREEEGGAGHRHTPLPALMPSATSAIPIDIFVSAATAALMKTGSGNTCSCNIRMSRPVPFATESPPIISLLLLLGGVYLTNFPVATLRLPLHESRDSLRMCGVWHH